MLIHIQLSNTIDKRKDELKERGEGLNFPHGINMPIISTIAQQLRWLALGLRSLGLSRVSHAQGRGSCVNGDFQ